MIVSEGLPKNAFDAISVNRSRDVFLRNHESQAGACKIAGNRQHKQVLARDLEASILENRLEVRSAK